MSLEEQVAQALAARADDVTSTPDLDALVTRGLRARRGRRAIYTAVVAAVVVLAAVVVGPALIRTADPGPVTEPPPTAPISPRSTPVPGRGAASFLGAQPAVYASFTVPSGWEVDGTWATKSGSDPEVSVGFVDVADVYTDGCWWRKVAPRPGPSVDDLVAAYARVPGAEAAEDVRIDGLRGKQIRVTVPDFNPRYCREGLFGLLQHDNEPGRGDKPSFAAAAPGERYTVTILEVRGSRLVIFAEYPPNISPQDRADLEAIVSSVAFG